MEHLTVKQLEIRKFQRRQQLSIHDQYEHKEMVQRDTVHTRKSKKKLGCFDYMVDQATLN